MAKNLKCGRRKSNKLDDIQAAKMQRKDDIANLGMKL